ncbi:MAG: peptidase S10 [Acidobacteria bacterium]|nr:peptidase S10 [Acidobacteriota bacterium]
MRKFVWYLVLAAGIPLLGIAKTTTPKPSPKPKAAATKTKVKARAVSTHHTVIINGQPLAYTATAGTIILHDAKDKPTAKMFYIAYTKDHVSNPATRPVTFSYNGGPGAASALVDIGGFGPRKLVWPQPGSTVAVRPPYEMKPNPATLLATTDLVFIDAIGTGYSRILPPHGTPKMFYGVKQDSSAFTQFIERYISKYGRWGSPKFLLGESYGTTRSAVLAQELIQHGIYLNGVVLCSTVLNFPTITFAPGDDLPYILYLPSYAATAWYHHRLNPEPKSLPDLVKKAEAFAAGPYASALFQGSALSEAERESVAKQLAAFTGLPASLCLKSNLRIPLRLFRRRVLGSADQFTGRYDSRYTLDELQPLMPINGSSNVGATTSATWGALTASFNDYLERHLNYHSEHHYRQLSYKVNGAWDWKYSPPVQDLLGGGAMFLNVAPALARAMTNDPGLELMNNNGYFDMATPFFATEYTLQHTSLPANVWKRITTDYYNCGHMLYLNPKALPVLSRNINNFIKQASSNQ